MGTQSLVKIFSKDIEKNLYPENEFYKNSKVDVVDPQAKTVEIPISGGKAGTHKNATQYPIQVAARQDDKTTYDLDFYGTDPILLEQVDELELNYNKRQDILDDHIEGLKTRFAEDVAYHWTKSVDASRKFATVGANGTNNNPNGDANKKVVTQKGIVKLAKAMDKDDIPRDNSRFLLVSAEQYSEISEIENFMSAEKIGSANYVEGMVGRIYGFNIFMRSKGLILNSSLEPQDSQHTIVTGDLDAIVAWHRRFVRRAEGRINVSINPNQADYDGGTIMSAQFRGGGIAPRSDKKGVYLLYQG